MRNVIRFNIIGILVLFLGISCTNSNLEGNWDDNIKLSQKQVEISGQNNSLLITTQGAGWWVNDINLDGVHIDISGVNTILNNFIIETPEFKIERRNATEIHINMYGNTTNSPRILNIGLQSGDYFDAIKITQLVN